MQIFAQGFSVQKHGNSPEEYEDAYWPHAKIDVMAPQFRFALGDGATETSFSALWAQLLVREYCRGKLRPERIEYSLPKLRAAWDNEVKKKQLPWFAEEKLRSGAFASILGLTVFDGAGAATAGGWRCLAVGDSCLCHVRNDQLLLSFPLAHSAEFNNHPVLLSSVARYAVDDSQVQKHEGSWESGDTFYLMSDAIACWFVQSIEAQERPWAILRDLDTSGQSHNFSDWITQLRGMRRIKNDDVTLLRVSLE